MPPANSVVVIPAGKTVILDGSTPPLLGLVVRGELLAGDADLSITTGALYVDGGKLQIGSESKPYLYQATITLTGTSTGDHPNTPGFGAKVLAQMGGVIDLHGRQVARSWTALAADAAAGSRSLVLAQAPGWRPGDQIVVSTSSRDQMRYSTGEIERIDGATVTLKAPLRYGHTGSKAQVAQGIVVDTRSHVGLLSRNIVIQGDASSAATKVGGHAMFMNAPSGTTTVRIAGVEFRSMGQFDQLGRYPVHFHLMERRCGGCYIRDSSVRDSIQRGIVVHDSAVEVKGNVVFNTVGHNIVVETATTEGAVIDGNLALVNHLPNPLFTDPGLVMQNDRQPSNFWFKSARNTVTNNVAAGALDSGFMYDHVPNGPAVFRRNIAYAAMSRGVETDFPTTAAMMLIFSRAGLAEDSIGELTAYHSTSGLWLEMEDLDDLSYGRAVPGLVADRVTTMANDIGLFARGNTNKVTLVDPVFVANPTRNQYGGIQTLVRPTFVNLPYGIGGGHDTAPHDSTLLISQPRLINSFQFAPDPMSFAIFDDDTIHPRGMYVPDVQRMLATPECARHTFVDASRNDQAVYWRCPRAYGYTEIDVRALSAPQVRLHTQRYIRRSDGVSWRGAGYTDGSAGYKHFGGEYGYAAYFDAGLSYSMVDLSPSGYAVRLSREDAPEVANERATVEVAVPVASAPSTVRRHGTRPDGPEASTGEHDLLRVASREALRQAPLTTYFYDATNGQVVFHASRRWVTVRP